jgi:hypothetical protein
MLRKQETAAFAVKRDSFAQDIELEKTAFESDKAAMKAH